ncbi:TlpA family protein disulfide reductase [Planomonospora algeriensis]
MSNTVVALIGVICVLCAVNLVFTVGMARRLRAHGESLSRRPGPGPDGYPPPGGFPPVMRGAGERLGSFSSTTVDGVPVDEGFLAGTTTLVAAFSVGCRACEERLPEFVRFAAAFPGGRERVLALVVGTDGVAEKLALLEPVATVVVEGAHGGPVCSSLGVTAYPALGLVEPGGVVRASGTLIQDVAVALEKV